MDFQQLAHIAWLVPALPLFGALVIAALRNKLKGNTAGYLATAMTSIAFVIALLAFIAHKPAEQASALVHLFNWIDIPGMEVAMDLRIDALSLTMMLIVTGIGSLIHMYSIGYMHDDKRVNTFFALLNLFSFAMLMLVMGGNFLVTFIGWEGVGLCSYLLIGFWYTVPAYNYAARKAFVMNRIGDLGFLIALVMIATQFGTLDYGTVMDKSSTVSTGSPWITAVTLLLFVGAIGKSAQLPLFTWLPDAMAGPTPVSALIHAATMVTAGIFLLVRSSALFALAPITMEVVLIVGLLTAVITATIGVFQNDIKKVLAYSTVSQLGLMFVALGLGAYSAAMFHVTTHAFFKALLFLGAGSVIHALGGEQDIRKMGGLKGITKTTYVTFLIGTLAIAGIPGFSGFFSKDAILMAAYQEHPLLYAATLGVSLLTCFYMFRLLFLTFFGTYRGKAHAHESPSVMTVPLMVLAVGSVVAGVLNLPHIFGGHETMKHYLETAAEGIYGEHLHLSAATEWMLMGITVGLIVLVIWYAHGRFVKKTTLDAEADELPYFKRLIARKWYIDELYAKLFEKPYGWLSTQLDAIMEKRVVDGAVNFTGSSTMRIGKLVRRVQTGNMSFYLLAMVVGIIGFLMLTIWGV
ncbi:MAG: NADH-quinone oxidoreductase subunit L [Flavobacteriales bacterium]|nr:NADH-quinone oxidoreductase subunit L [Flavobacteriales bacterium]